MNSAVTLINTGLGRDAANAAVGQGVEAHVRASMRGVLEGNWLETRDQELFKAAVAGAMLHYPQGSPNFLLIEDSFKILVRFTHWLTAAKAGAAGDLPSLELDGGRQPLPLLKWWDEIKVELGK